MQEIEDSGFEDATSIPRPVAAALHVLNKHRPVGAQAC